MAPPAYVTADEWKAWSDTPDANTARAEGAIRAASAAIDAFTGRIWSRREVTEELLGQGTKILLPAATPVVSIGTATVDGTLVSLATRGGRQIVRVDGRAFELGAVVQVTMTAGPAELDPSVRDACMIAATAAYGAFVFDPNVAGEGVDGVFSGGFSQFGPGALPLAARTILTPLRRPVLL